MNALIASGGRGQTTETIEASFVFGPGKVGLGPDGLVPANPARLTVLSNDGRDILRGRIHGADGGIEWL